MNPFDIDSRYDPHSIGSGREIRKTQESPNAYRHLVFIYVQKDKAI